MPCEQCKITILISSTTKPTETSNLDIVLSVYNAFCNITDKHCISLSCLATLEQDVCENKPSVVLLIGSVLLDSNYYFTLKRICKETNSKLFFWITEDPYEFDYSWKIVEIADVIFSNDKWTIDHYTRDNVYHLPLAGDIHNDYCSIEPNENKTIDVSFCGYAYDNRIEILTSIAPLLSKYKTFVCGTNWPNSLSFAKNVKLSYKDFIRLCSLSKLVLNIGRELSFANSQFQIVSSTPGPRTFQVALAGAIQIYFSPGLEIFEYFENQSEILLFENVLQLEALLDRILTNYSEYSYIAANSQQRAISEHCYENRASKILDVAHIVLNNNVVV